MKVTRILGLLLLGLLFLPACIDDDWLPDIDPNETDYRHEMKVLVQQISQYAKWYDGDFLVVPQNGELLITDDGTPNSYLSAQYMNAIDGLGREDLYYGYNADNVLTPVAERDAMIEFLDLAKGDGKKIMVADYCWTQTFVDNSYLQNNTKGYISFAAPSRDLDEVPTYPAAPYQVSTADITDLDDAKNFLYLLDPGQFNSRTDYLNALNATNYDVLIIDLYYDDQALSQSEITSLKTKANGGERILLAYMSIGEIEDYRYYWENDWDLDMPSWILAENPDWPGNYYIEYWQQSWKDILFGSESSYIKRIMDAGFDGVWLDGVDHWEYFIPED